MFLKTVLLVALSIAYVQAQNDGEPKCGSCPSERGITCTGKSTWRYCFGSLIDPVENDCGGGYVCTYKTQEWCMPEIMGASCADPVKPGKTCEVCTKFGKNDFACLGEAKFARCMNGEVSKQYQGNCPQGYVCNLEDPKMCVSKLQKSPSCLNK